MAMDKQIYKKRCERLRQWQKKPFEYEFANNEEHKCNNCEHTFKGNYCPYCSQKAGEGYIGWDSVRQSVMDVWGLGSHSLPNTVLQLLVRPGYLISDYISGEFPAGEDAIHRCRNRCFLDLLLVALHSG